MKVLVTGSLGLVGSATQEIFTEKGWDVVGIDNNMRSRLFGTPNQEGEHVELDIRDYERLRSLFKERGPFDAIVHTAGQPSHDWSKENPMADFFINTVGTLNLLECVREFTPKAVFVYVSTDKVYGQGMWRDVLKETPTRWHNETPFDETTPFEAAYSPFGVAKLSADLYVQEYAFQYGIKTACFRPGCITGRNHQGAEKHGFLAYLAKCIREGKKYTIFGFKGKQVRDQIHARDLARAFYAFVQKPKKGAVYNIGGGPERSISILEAGEALSKHIGKPFIYTYEERERFADRPWDVIDVTKFRKDYPEWDYQYNLQDIINDIA